MRYKIVLMLFMICLVMFATPVFCVDSCPLYLVKEAGGGDVIMDVVQITDGEVLVFQVGPGLEVIEVVWPISPGKSGNLVQRSTENYTLIVMYSDGSLSLRSRKANGKERTAPSIRPEDVCGYNVRVNIIGENGVKKAFSISRCGEPVPDNGPVFDIFGGQFPMSPGDYTVTIETTLAERFERIAGAVPVFLNDGMLICRAAIGGREGNFIVDTGADGSLVHRDFLPEGTDITRLTAIAYSDSVEVRDGVMQGAGGEVSSFLGVATLAEIRTGSMRFEDVDVSVVSDLLEAGDIEIDGIIGLNLLRRADAVTICYPGGAAETGELVLHPAAEGPVFDGHEIPFVLADKHIFVDGSLDGTPARFLVDSGARMSFVPPVLCSAAGLEKMSGGETTVSGLDGNRAPAATTRVESLALDGIPLGNATFYTADLAVLKNWGIDADTALLGNDLLITFGKVTLDFESKTVRFAQPVKEPTK